MPYKNPKDPRARESRRKHYYTNKEQYFNRNRKRKREIRAILKEFKKPGCIIKTCSEKDSCVIDIHHLRDKDIAPAKLVNSGWSTQRIMLELAKCVPVCSNCHRKIHAGKIKIGE